MRAGRTHHDGRLRAALAARPRLGDLPAVAMLAWAGWLAMPWSFSGLAQAQAAATEAARSATAVPPSPDTATAPTSVAALQPPSPTSSIVQALHLGAADTVHALGHRPPDASPRVIPADCDLLPRIVPADSDLSPRATPTASDLSPQVVPATSDPSPRVTPAEFVASSQAIGAGSECLATGPGAGRQVLSHLTDGQFAGGDLLAEERAKLAAEVHDAAGHGFAAIAMQANVALRLLDRNPEQARASLEAILATSTEALSGLRGALDSLDPSSAAAAPDTDLGKLIDGVRATGLAVSVGPYDPVPAHLRAPVYGVVRESLTNVLRHARTAGVSVKLAAAPSEFVVEVLNRGEHDTNGREHLTQKPGSHVQTVGSHPESLRDHAAGPRSRTGVVGSQVEGRGLAGMRAQVRAVGGSLIAGPRPDGGFQVIARFPVMIT